MLFESFCKASTSFAFGNVIAFIRFGHQENLKLGKIVEIPKSFFWEKNVKEGRDSCGTLLFGL